MIPSDLNTFPHIDNFARFLVRYPEHTNEIHELIKALGRVENPILREKTYAHINLELGVILMQDQEVGRALVKLFETENLLVSD